MNITKKEILKMTSQWTSKYDIMRDLCLAQGGIPVDISQTITAKAKPPVQAETEENEIENFGSLCEDVEFQSGPDLVLIKQMLNMIKETNIYPETVPVGNDSVVEISKVNPQCKESGNVHQYHQTPKKKRQRNVAIASLLEALSSENKILDHNETIERMHKTDRHIKLLKPTDFMTNIETCDTVVIINEFVSSAKTGIIFKKKINEKKVHDNNEENSKTETKTFGAYKPSIAADLYYKKYLERSKFKESIQNNVKAKADNVGTNIEAKELDIVRIPQHRHLLTDDCIVCRALCKKYIE